MIPLLILLTVWTPSSAVPQDKVSDSRLTETEEGRDFAQYSDYVVSGFGTRFEIQHNGTLGAIAYSYRRYITPLPLIELMLEPKVVDEIGILDYQEKELREIAERLKNAIAESDRLHGEQISEDQAFKQKIFELIDAPSRRAFSVVDELLVPLQVEQLAKILQSYQIRRFGLFAALTKTGLSKKLKLERSQLADLELEFKKRLPDALRELHALRKECIEKLLSHLSKDQYAQVQHLFIKEFQFSTVPTSVFVSQLDSGFLERVGELKVDNPWPEYLPLVYGNEFTVGLNGQLTFSDSIETIENPSIDIAWQLLGIFDQHSPVRTIFELSETQIEEFESIAWMRETQFEIDMREGNEIANKLGWGEFKKWWQREIPERRRALANKVIQRIERALLPFQRELLSSLVAVVGCQRTGIVFSLVKGELGKKIGITKKQKKKILAEATRWRKRIQMESVKIEKRLNDQLFAVLTESQRK